MHRLVKQIQHCFFPVMGAVLMLPSSACFMDACGEPETADPDAGTLVAADGGTAVDLADGGLDGGALDGGALEDFTLLDAIAPQILMLAEGIEELEDDPLTWASRSLVHVPYDGALRAPGAVLAAYQGNALDRCVLVRHLLSAVEIPSRYRLWGDDECGVEALVDGDVQEVATSYTPVPIPADAAVAQALPEEVYHRFDITETIEVLGVVSEEDVVSLRFHEIEAGLAFRYEMDDDTRLEMTLPGGEVVVGAPVGEASSHRLRFNHVAPSGATQTYERLLFDSDAEATNQGPDADDAYVAFLGAHLVTPAVIHAEAARLVDQDDARPTDALLYMRALELAERTDNAAWQAFIQSETEGGLLFDRPRIIIAALEQRSQAPAPLVPSYDLLANDRHVVGLDDESTLAEISMTMGMLDGVVEGAALEATSGVVPVTAPQLFAALFAEDNHSAARVDLFADALSRLLDEGVTEEGLRFYDPDVEAAQLSVVLVSGDLVVFLENEVRDAFAVVAGELWDDVTETEGGAILPNTSDGSILVEAFLLWQGASHTYLPRLDHQESPQIALATPSGTYLRAIGTYDAGEGAQAFTAHAVSRLFEEAPEGESDLVDRADWHRTDDAAVVIGGGHVDEDTPSLTANNPYLMQWGADEYTGSSYDSPLWIAPAVAAGIRAGAETDLRIRYDREGVVEWAEATLTQFSIRKMALHVDGVQVSVEVIDAKDADETHGVTIARYGLTRLVLGVETPIGQASIEEILTPRTLRLRGRVVSMRGPTDRDGIAPLKVGVKEVQVNVPGEGNIGLGWPDGFVDLRVPGTAKPTLQGSIAVLVDSSLSMDENADADCATDCLTKRDVVHQVLNQLAGQVPDVLELALWRFESFPGGVPDTCPSGVQVVSDWSLNHGALADAFVYSTSATPLSGAVRGAVNAMDEEPLGLAKRLIVLADGDNDCPDALGNIALPDDLEVHTIGVGLAEGSAGETELQALATNGGGTYTRTTGSADLLSALTDVTVAPLVMPSTQTEVDVTLSAPDHLNLETVFPVDANNVEILMELDPDRPDVPQLLVIAETDTYPTAQFDHSDEAITRISEARARNPSLRIVVPDRMINFGMVSQTLAWIEIDTVTHVSTTVTLDTLHGSAVFLLGTLIAGLWAGAYSVIDNFCACATGGCGLGAPMGIPPDIVGCGSTVEDVTANICKMEASDGFVFTVFFNFVSMVLSPFQGFAVSEGFTLGVGLAVSACGGDSNVASGTVDNILQTLAGSGAAWFSDLPAPGSSLYGWAVSIGVAYGQSMQ
jgi:hypothetical protein